MTTPSDPRERAQERLTMDYPVELIQQPEGKELPSGAAPEQRRGGGDNDRKDEERR